MRYLIAAGLFVVAFATPLRAQLVVIDPANLAQAILIADRTRTRIPHAPRPVPDDCAYGAGSREP